MARRVLLFVPLPMIRSPAVVTGDSALNAAALVVCPVPPLASAKVPASVSVPDEVIGFVPETVMPVVPPDKPTDVTVPAGDKAAMLAAVTLKFAPARETGIASVLNAGSPAVRALILVLGIDYSNKM